MEILTTLGGIPFSEEVGDYLNIAVRFCYKFVGFHAKEQKHMSTESFCTDSRSGKGFGNTDTEHQGRRQLGATSFTASV